MELTAAEGRVLGCLIEQEAAASDAVPLTLNTLRLACNQTSGRDPVVAYDDRLVEDTLLSLKSRGLARFVAPSAEARTTRYRHRADERWRMGSAELAVLAVLLLGGLQTVAEVRARAQRLHPLITPAEVEAVLDSLAARTPRPFAARVAGNGGGETRWVQILTGPAPADHRGAGGAMARAGGLDLPADRALAELAPSYAALVARVVDLEQRLAEALERRVPAGAEWSAPYPPPPPPVEVTPPARLVARPTDDRRDPRLGPVRPSATPAAPDVDVHELADRVSDIERRLARIEAELGALR
jgi:uncharacterized protein YceH (UPF0502 family)